METNKDKIIKLYFEENYLQVAIAKEIQVSTNYVSKVLKKDKRFEIEKLARKEKNKIKHNKQIQSKVEEKRKKTKSLKSCDDLILKAIHNQASRELSGGRKPISDRAFRDWNTSAYRYDYKTKSYILKKEITTGQDVPRRVNWKNFE